MHQSNQAAPGQNINPNSDERAKEIAHLAGRIGNVNDILGIARDIARIYADLAHEIPDTSKGVTIDAQALRGSMTLFTARLEDAIESLGEVQAMVSLIDDKSDV